MHVSRKASLLSFVILFSLFLQCAHFAQAQIPSKVLHEGVALSAIDEDRKMACAYSALLLDVVNQSDQKQLQTALGEEIKRYEDFMAKSEASSSQTLNLRKRVLNDLREANAAANQQVYYGQALGWACRSLRSSGGAALSTTALSASLITSAITLPIRFIGKLFIGGITRKATPEKGPSYTELLGQQGMQTEIVSIAYEIIRAALGAGSPLAIPRILITGVDLQAAKRCSEVNRANPGEKKFCERYQKIKRKEFEWSESGERVGIRIGNFMLAEFDLRADRQVDQKLSSQSVSKQYREARRAKERLLLEINHKHLSSLTVNILAPAANTPVALNLSASPGHEEELAQIGAVIDGLEIKRNSQPMSPSPSQSAIADFVSTADAADVCTEIQNQKTWKASVKPELNDAMIEAAQFAMNPNRYAHLATELIQMPMDMVARQELTEMKSGRNVVLMIAPSEEQTNQYGKLKADEADVKKQLKVQTSKLRVILKESSVSDCRAAQAVVKFDWKEFNRLNQQLKSQDILHRIDEFKQMHKQTEKAGRKFWVFKTLKRDWEVVEMRNLNNLRSLLTDSSVQNLVIVSHGDVDGKIIDSRFNELPHNAFAWIAPEIQSVSFFSCHSQKALDTYQLAQHLKEQVSYHQLRILGSVKTESFLEASNQVPTGALSEYLERLDHRLDLAAKGSERVQTWLRTELMPFSKVAVCSIELSGMKVANGEFGVLVNGTWVGSLYPESQLNEKFNFPCEWNKENHPVVFLENQSLIEKSSLILDEPQVKSGDLLIKSPQIILRSDNTVKALRFERN